MAHKTGRKRIISSLSVKGRDVKCSAEAPPTPPVLLTADL